MNTSTDSNRTLHRKNTKRSVTRSSNRLGRPPAVKSNDRKASEQSTASAPAPPQPNVTKVQANIDVGFGNTLFIRGQGDGLSWEKGIPLLCVAPSTWVWSTTKAEQQEQQVIFKLLLNDAVWAEGQDWTVAAGSFLEVTPEF